MGRCWRQRRAARTRIPTVHTGRDLAVPPPKRHAKSACAQAAVESPFHGAPVRLHGRKQSNAHIPLAVFSRCPCSPCLGSAPRP